MRTTHATGEARGSTKRGDRYRGPMWRRRVMGGVGRLLLGFGVLVLLFCAYQLFGTTLTEARHQRSLKKDLREALAQPATTPPSGSGTSAAAPVALAPAEGEAMALLH